MQGRTKEAVSGVGGIQLGLQGGPGGHRQHLGSVNAQHPPCIVGHKARNLLHLHPGGGRSAHFETLILVAPVVSFAWDAWHNRTLHQAGLLGNSICINYACSGLGWLEQGPAPHLRR